MTVRKAIRNGIGIGQNVRSELLQKLAMQCCLHKLAQCPFLWYTNMYGHMDGINLNMNIGSIRFANRF